MKPLGIPKDGGWASGFKCPNCDHAVSDVVTVNLPQVELRCWSCYFVFAVET